MPLIMPTAVTTYGDSTLTEGGTLRKYILAVFRSDSTLDWVGFIRSSVGKDELKYGDFVRARHRLIRDRVNWKRIEAGVGQASIIVIDPEPVVDQLVTAAKSEAVDPAIAMNTKLLTESCATALIEGTPIAYLPQSLARAVPWSIYDPVATLDDFSPQTIRNAIGSGLRKAQIFAARAHAAFDLRSTAGSVNH